MQWMIFDSYMQEWNEKEAKEQEEQARTRGKDKKPATVVQAHQEDPLYSQSMKSRLKIMERMIVQNFEKEKFNDYKYYEDNTTEPTAPNYGSVLPLWRFTSDKGRKKNVTAMCWNPRFMDLFAVGYGSYEFVR